LGIGCDPNQNGGILIPGSTGQRLRQTPNHQWNTGIGGSCISQMETHPPITPHRASREEKRKGGSNKIDHLQTKHVSHLQGSLSPSNHGTLAN